MPIGKQIRAARMLVGEGGWSADELAHAAGLSRECILQAERGDTNLRDDTEEKIVRAFGDEGIIFDGDSGIKLLPDNYRILTGRDCYLRLLDDVYKTLAGTSKAKAQALFICVDDAISTPEVVEANNRLRAAGITCRYLCSERASRFDFDLSDYRAIPEKFYKNSVMIIYGNKVTTLRAKSNTVQIVKDAEQADMLRGLFGLIWEKAAMPKPSKKTTGAK